LGIPFTIYMESNMDDQNEIMEENGIDCANTSESESIDTNDANTAEKAVGSEVYNPEEWSSAPLRDPKTGRWAKGTGGSRKGGRPVGARDKITNQMIRLAEETAAEYGEQMFKKLAKDDPAACLALITRLLPNSDLSKAIEGESGDQDAIQQVTINLVSSPNPRLSDSRTDQQIEDRQRGLESPVERLPEPVEEAEVVSTQEAREAADEDAVRAERERIRRQNDAIKAHGGLTGRAPRSSGPVDPIEYRDNEEWV
jgi:hypothetical protein